VTGKEQETTKAESLAEAREVVKRYQNGEDFSVESSACLWRHQAAAVFFLRCILGRRDG
jgi:hypothetical protein